MKDYTFSVQSIEEMGGGIFKLILSSDTDLEESIGGQFIHLQIPDGKFLLRRPFCIYNRRKNRVEICFAVTGAGTAALSKIKAGEKIHALMPLGNGFYTGDKKRIALLGGGMGAAALFSLTEKNPDIKFTAYLGFATAEKAVFTNDFKRNCDKVRLFTDDGSAGEKGYPLTGLVSDLNGGINYDAIFICGPLPMVRGAKNALSEVKTDIFVSMEERMGCGIGACLVCTCKTDDNGIKNKRVCKDGPVFELKNLVL